MRNIAVMTGRAGAGKTTIAVQLQDLGFVRVRFAEKLKAMARALGLNDDEIEGHLKEVPCAKLTFEAIMGNTLSAIDKAFNEIVPELYNGDDDVTQPVEMFGGKSINYAATTFVHVVLNCVAKAGPEGATPRSLMQMIGTDWGRKMIREDLWIDLWRREVNALPEGANIVIDDCRFPNEHAECKAQGNTIVFRITRNTASALAGEVEKSHESEAYQLEYDFLVENNGLTDAAAHVVRKRVQMLNYENANGLSGL